MSVVAMWNNGLETRKAEVSRRLRERAGRFHQLWLDENGISIPPAPSNKVGMEDDLATPKKARFVGLGIAMDPDSDVEEEKDTIPSPPREVVMGRGGLLTPSATRSGGRRVGKRTFHMDEAELDRQSEESE